MCAGFVFGWWEHEAFNIDRIRSHCDSGDDSAVGACRDKLYEVASGFMWGFAPRRPLRPENLWIRDEGHVFLHNCGLTGVVA